MIGADEHPCYDCGQSRDEHPNDVCSDYQQSSDFDPSDCAFCCIAVRPLPNGADPGCPLHGTAVTGVQPAPTAAEVVSAARTLLDALRYQPALTGDVAEAQRRVEQVIDRYDKAPRIKTTPLTVAASHAEVTDRHRRTVEALNAQAPDQP